MYSAHFLGALLAAARDVIDSAGPPGLLQFYAGSQPSPGGAPTGTLQVQMILPKPCGAVDGYTLTISTPIEALRVGSDPIQWARLFTGTGTWLMDLTVSVIGGGGHIELDSLSGYPGGSVTLTACTIGF